MPVLKKLFKVTDLDSLQKYMSDNNLCFWGSEDMWLYDPERAERCAKAVEFGCNGSTHQEVIKDQKIALEICLDVKDVQRSVYGDLMLELDIIESWHEKAGTLFNEIG